ncbi:unnamed protein product [Peronospora belbahrii]|uniref:Uncharacterized protein n=1 Tax=Peronospora belbahrii TaxID=622444 RepID=A0ABN8D3M1_9STRA|nr:unnamed protein product [Peronospora belbahrii]
MKIANIVEQIPSRVPSRVSTEKNLTVAEYEEERWFPNDGAELVAGALTNYALIEEWLAAENLPPHIVPKIGLCIHDMANKELANQKLAWLKHYVDRYNMKYSPSNLTLYDTLSNYFEESGIVKMLAFWKEDAATAITTEQQTWIHETKHPIDVFKESELNNVVSSPLASPKLEYWISYKNRYNTRNPKRSTSLLLTLDHCMARMVWTTLFQLESKQLQYQNNKQPND